MESEVKRIFHPWDKWEDYRAGFYEKPSGKVKNDMIASVLAMFESSSLTQEYMNRVISDWPLSCEHNLTNNALNRVAYLGQGACCIYAGVPSSVTMEAWSMLSPQRQDEACKIAESVLESWIKSRTNA